MLSLAKVSLLGSHGEGMPNYGTPGGPETWGAHKELVSASPSALKARV